MSDQLASQDRSHLSLDGHSLNEERLRLALSGTSITMYQQDMQLRYAWIYNPLSAFTAEFITGKTDADFVLPDEARRLTEVKQQVLRTGNGVRIELSTTSAASVHFHDLTVEPLRDNTGTVIGVTGVSVDITERKQMEATLRQSETLRRFIMESMPQKIFTATPNGEIDYFNQQWMEFTGLSFEQIRDWAGRSLFIPMMWKKMLVAGCTLLIQASHSSLSIASDAAMVSIYGT